MDTYRVQIAGNVVIETPRRLESLSTWVLLEQEDWFEPEIKLLRRFLRDGMAAIDIGANIGVYAISLARLVGETGRIWAFEPVSETAAMLAAGVAANRLANVQVLQQALSREPGRAHIQLSTQGELNSLRRTGPSIGSEVVDVTTLDRFTREANLGPIDFVKIDAEGEEEDIVAGSRSFFSEQSPLVMIEVCAAELGGNRNLAACAALHALGYDLYRCTGPDEMLMPLVTGIGGADNNYFACKPDRAASLAERGLLASHVSPSPAIRDEAFSAAIAAFELWQDSAVPAAARCTALMDAYNHASIACRENASGERFSVLARTALCLGERFIATQAATQALAALSATDKVSGSFIPAAPRFDAIGAAEDPKEWLLASCLETFEASRAFSGYFIPTELQRMSGLDWLRSSRYASAPMERRRQLQRIRAGLEREALSPLLAQRTSDNLNPELWSIALRA
jgi:FkbM family methyltransferase